MLKRSTYGGNIVRSASNWEWIVSSISKKEFSGYRNNQEFLFKAREKPTLHIISVTNECNHSCHYCHMEAKPISIISPKKLDEIDTLLVDYIIENSHSRFTIEFQGGEPLLEWKRIISIIKIANEKAKLNSKKVKFVVCSNLSLVNAEIIEFAKDFNISFSTTLGGSKDAHNRYRTHASDSTSSYDKVIKSIESLQENGIKTGVIVVLPPDTLDTLSDVIDALLRLGMSSMFFKPVYPMGYASISKSKYHYDNYEYYEFYKNMLNTCITLNEKYIPFFESFSVMLLEKILGGYEPYYPDLLSPCGAFDIQIAYDLNGNVFTCDDARFGKGIPIGTIHESLATLKEHQFLLDIKKYSKTTESFCGACAYRPWCGRCPIMNLKQGIAMDAKSIHSNYCKHMEGTFDAIFDLIIEDRGRIESYFKLARATKLL